MKFNYTIEEWSVSKLLTDLENNYFAKLPHQRPLTLKRNSSKKFIESALNNDLLELFIFADLQTSFECSDNEEDKNFFNSYLKKGKVLSIEDCQHRMASLQLITDDDFVGEYEGRKEEFLNCKIFVGILKYATKSELIRKFGKVNSGKPVTNDNLMWGVNNIFNNFIKTQFISDEKYLRIYKTKKKSDSVERIIYGNILKIIKVCGSNDGFLNSSSTNADSMMLFVKSDTNINQFNGIFSLFNPWYELVKTIESRESFTTQSDLFFIIHILNKKNMVLDGEKINNILSTLTDTRSSPEKRYNNILSIIENEG